MRCVTIKLVSQDLFTFVLISIIFKSWDTDVLRIDHSHLYVYPLSLFIPFIPFQIMRKIERQMNEAILNRKDFFSSNTSVENYVNNITGAKEAVVKLHGNHIATVGETLQICDAGWQTVTTKSRLNALCNEFAYGCYVFQKNYDWFLGDADGNKIPFPTEEFVTV